MKHLETQHNSVVKCSFTTAAGGNYKGFLDSSVCQAAEKMLLKKPGDKRE